MICTVAPAGREASCGDSVPADAVIAAAESNTAQRKEADRGEVGFRVNMLQACSGFQVL
jgi:hypothetical protein